VIVVSDGRISAAGRRSAVAIPPDAKPIDATGKFVIPGLMDANVHLVLGSSIEFVVRYEGHYEDLIEEAAQVTLKNGVTTVFDSWGRCSRCSTCATASAKEKWSAAACSSRQHRRFSGPLAASSTATRRRRRRRCW